MTDAPFAVIVITGCGGAGKTTVAKKLMERDRRLVKTRSVTSRTPRPGETPDDYEFISKEEFERRVAQDAKRSPSSQRFWEYVAFAKDPEKPEEIQYYGTLAQRPPVGKHFVMAIEYHGAETLKERFGDRALVVYLSIPDEIAQERMLARGDDESSIKARLQHKEHDDAWAKEHADVIIDNSTNDEASSAVHQAARAISHHLARMFKERSTGRNLEISDFR